jgi:hypothetical protein
VTEVEERLDEVEERAEDATEPRSARLRISVPKSDARDYGVCVVNVSPARFPGLGRHSRTPRSRVG